MSFLNILSKKVTMSERTMTLVKFGTVGASGVIVNNAILLLFVTFGVGDLVSSLIATECAIISNFIGNMFWTWNSHSRDDWQKKFAKFQLISIIAGLLTVGLFWTFNNVFGIPLLIANTMAILITFVINFSLNRRFTWKVAQ